MIIYVLLFIYFIYIHILLILIPNATYLLWVHLEKMWISGWNIVIVIGIISYSTLNTAPREQQLE